MDTRAPGDATTLSREAAAGGYDLVVALGGDGTVNEAANGLLGSSTPLSCLPGGSANVFGKLLGIPGDLLDATEHLLGLADDWRQRRVDLGVVNGRCFTFNSGLGLDAMVVEQVDSNPHLKARLGPYYYSWVAVSTFLRRYLRRPPRLRVQAGGRTLDGVHRDRPERRHLHLLPGPPDRHRRRDRELDSGELAGGVLHRAGLLSMLSIAWRAFSPRARVSGHRQVTPLRGAAGADRAHAPTGARCRCRPTATSSARWPKRATRSCRTR